jgi:Uma2 family endonuclease
MRRMSIHEQWTEPRPVKLTVQDFSLLDRAGVFDHYQKTELIDGRIVAVNAQHRPHARAKSLLYRRLADALEALGSRLEVLVEVSVAIPPDHLPEPDLTVTSDPIGEGPVPVQSVALVVEVADTTAAYDRGEKASIYAAGGIPECWVVDLTAGEVARFWEAAPSGYGRADAVALGKAVEAMTLAGLIVATSGF